MSGFRRRRRILFPTHPNKQLGRPFFFFFPPADTHNVAGRTHKTLFFSFFYIYIWWVGGWEVGGRDDDGDWMWPPRGDQSAALVHWCNIKPTAAGVGFGAPGRVDIQHPFSSPVYTSLCPSGGPHSIARESTTSPSNSQHLLLLPPPSTLTVSPSRLMAVSCRR